MGWLSKQLNTFQNFKDPRIKLPGVFCFPQGRMTDRKIREAEFTRQHTLSPEQFKKLLEDKTARARQYYDAVSQKREVTESCRQNRTV